MIYVYAGLVTFSFFYFFINKRQFDFFSLAFVGVLIYSYPLFFGYSTLSINFYEDIHYDIPAEIYASYLWVVVTVLFFAFIYDVKHGKRSTGNILIRGNDEIRISLFLFICFFFASLMLFFLIVNLINVGLLFEIDKHNLMKHLGWEANLYRTASLLGFAVSVLAKRKMFVGLFFCLVFFDVYIQNRTMIFGLIVVLVTVLLRGKSERWAISRWYLGVIAAALLFILYSAKGVVILLKSGAGYRDVVSYLEVKFFNQFLSFFSRQSEPQIIVSSFIESINNNITLSVEYMATNIANFLPFSRTLFGLEVERFNQFIQPLFPFFQGGIASNFLAEAYAFSPIWMVFLIVFFGVGVYFSNWFFFRSSHSLLAKSFFLVNAPYMTIYIFRNDMSFIWGWFQRNLIVFVAISITTFLVLSVLRTLKPRPKSQSITSESRAMYD